MRVCRDCLAEWREKDPANRSARPPTRPIVENSGGRCASHWRDEKKRRKDAAHEKRVQKVYGLPPGAYEMLYRHQGGRCAICQRSTGARKKLAVDHDHDTGLAFGLLCSPCNHDVLGWSRRQVEYFQRCIDYLRNPPAKQLRLVAYHEENRKEE